MCGEKTVFSIAKFFKSRIGPGSATYGILKRCPRCVYQYSWEPILIFSKERGPRIIVNLEGNNYVREGPCPEGFGQCGKCFEAVLDPSKFKCKWKAF